MSDRPLAHRALPLRASAILLAALAAHSTGTSLVGQTVGVIATGVSGSTVSSQANWRRSTVMAPDGSLWAVVRDLATDGTGQLYLRTSRDGGATWTGRYDLPTTEDGAAALDFGPGCETLHVGWHALDGGSWANVYHQEFDVATGSWVGQPNQLVAGSSANDQFYISDVCVTAGGAVVVAITTHRAPVGNWTSGWSAGIFVRPAGAAAFDPVRQVNTDTYGQRIDCQNDGEIIHMSFRTNTGLYGTRYRGFDCATGQFTSASDVQVALATANVAHIGMDDTRTLYVIYTTGGSSPGTGEIRMATAPAANPATWTSHLVASDADLLKGNVSDVHYSLANAPGAIFPVYSKKTADNFQTLYYQVWSGGVQVLGETVAIATTDAERFRVVGGVRNPGDALSTGVVVENRSSNFPDRQVEYVRLGSAARGTEFGSPCQGSLAAPPRLSLGALPIGGGMLDLRWSDAPASQPVAAFADPFCLTPPFDLSAIGAPGCAIAIGTSVSFAVGTTSGTGTANLQLAIPMNPTFAGQAVHFQSVVVAPGANLASIVLTNAVTMVAD